MMTDEEIINALAEIAKLAPTAYLFDACKMAAKRIAELNNNLDFARKQNEMLGALAMEKNDDSR